MDNGGIWPGDESYFQNIRETALQDTIEQLTKELADKDKQLAEARAENVRLAKTMQLAIAINLAMQESSYDMPDLRGHECLAKHKLLSLFDLWRKKVRPRLPGFIDDEISKRDKLIEQMREALKLALTECRSTHCGDEIKAALLAAGRMKV